ncbi:MAG: hypothetical protein JWO52_7963, partial [Gammaproteobacteria bacterium]|nr:hypothetical protein [Gammaproteobacteria bacterium]
TPLLVNALVGWHSGCVSTDRWHRFSLRIHSVYRTSRCPSRLANQDPSDGMSVSIFQRGASKVAQCCSDRHVPVELNSSIVVSYRLRKLRLLRAVQTT